MNSHAIVSEGALVLPSGALASASDAHTPRGSGARAWCAVHSLFLSSDSPGFCFVD